MKRLSVLMLVAFSISVTVVFFYYYRSTEDLKSALGIYVSVSETKSNSVNSSKCGGSRETTTTTTTSTEEEREQVLNRLFSPIEDGAVLMEIERDRPEAERDRMAVVNAIVGGYDNGPPLVNPELHNHPKVSFFFFCDEGFTYKVSEPWQVIKTPYYDEDKEVDRKTKNSLSVLQDIKHINNMKAKYFDHLGWRLPDLRAFRYILYLGGGFNLSAATPETLYYQVVRNLRKENKTMIVPRQPNPQQTIVSEAQLASGQVRYSKDRVMQQAQHYAEDWLCPLIPGQVLGLGIMFYDAYSVAMRRVLYELYQECQLWTLEDQVAFPFLLWKHGMTDSIIKVHDVMCSQYLNVHGGGVYPGACRGHHAVGSAYGQ